MVYGGCNQKRASGRPREPHPGVYDSISPNPRVIASRGAPERPGAHTAASHGCLREDQVAIPLLDLLPAPIRAAVPGRTVEDALARRWG
jgi:hypothetical protein